MTPLAGPGDPARGAAIVQDRALSACLLCHAGPFPAPHLQGTIGPRLNGVGSRLTEGEIRLRIADPARVVPNTVMPGYYLTEGLNRVGRQWQGKTILTAQQIEDVVAFLVTLR
jgi:sulfur-oxidizing protein SoxX